MSNACRRVANSALACRLLAAAAIALGSTLRAARSQDAAPGDASQHDAAPAAADDAPARAEFAARVASLLAQLDRGRPSERAEAEAALVDLGLAAPGDGESFLALLPEADNLMSQEALTRVARVRSEVQSRLAERHVQQTRVTLDVADAPLADVLAELQRQTGNHVIDNRSEFTDNPPEKRVTLKVHDEPFWSALDKLLDAANMSPYPYAQGDALALVDREQGVLRRSGRATYAGPFRIEPTSVLGRRGLRSPDQSEVSLELEISWEPRLRTVALAQAATELSAASDDGLDVPAVGEEEVFNVEVPADSYAAEVTLPLQLPSRAAGNLSKVAGRLTALVPGRTVDFKFSDLASAKDAVQEIGGIKVTLNRAAKNQKLWEINARVAIGALDGAANLPRGWVFQNLAYLESKSGERVDHAGYETTMQDEVETGFAYFFELPEGHDIAEYAWVYRTPAALVRLPVDYELKDIPLP